jgi:hypothetical protein
MVKTSENGGSGLAVILKQFHNRSRKGACDDRDDMWYLPKRPTRGEFTMSQRTWFITGASSGFGRQLTDQLLKRGDRVIGTVRDTGKVSDLLRLYPASVLPVLKRRLNSPLRPTFLLERNHPVSALRTLLRLAS